MAEELAKQLLLVTKKNILTIDTEKKPHKP